MTLNIEKRLESQLEALEELTIFRVHEERLYPNPTEKEPKAKDPSPPPQFEYENPELNLINTFTSYQAYRDHIDVVIAELKEFLLDVLQEIKNDKMQHEYINKIYEKIIDLEFTEVQEHIDKAEKIYDKLNETGEYPFPWEVAVYYKEDNWEAQVAQAATDYLEINDRLQEILNYIIVKGGYTNDAKGNLTGPHKADYFTKRKFTTDLNVYELAIFIQLCIEYGIFKPGKGKKAKKQNSTRTDIAKMISENFIKDDSYHLTVDSIINKMKFTSTDKDFQSRAKKTRRALMARLDKMIKKLDSYN